MKTGIRERGRESPWGTTLFTPLSDPGNPRQRVTITHVDQSVSASVPGDLADFRGKPPPNPIRTLLSDMSSLITLKLFTILRSTSSSLPSRRSTRWRPCSHPCPVSPWTGCPRPMGATGAGGRCRSTSTNGTNTPSGACRPRCWSTWWDGSTLRHQLTGRLRFKTPPSPH